MTTELAESQAKRDYSPFPDLEIRSPTGDQMYFLSNAKQRELIEKIISGARSGGVSDDLRGWNCHKSPMKPNLEERIPMYSVCSKYCPTSRDVFLDRVKKATPRINQDLILGVALHRVVGAVMNGFLEGKLPNFDAWYEENLGNRGVTTVYEGVKQKSRTVWNRTVTDCERHLSKSSNKQPYISKRDILATAMPFLVEHKLTAEPLGLSGTLSVDCYDYLRRIVFDLKIAWDEEEWHKLTPTGSAIAIESVYEIPVDVGCILYL